MQIDLLMITHRRPGYTSLALPRLLETCDERMRVWVWHNGDDVETLDVVRGLRSHPRFHRFHHSPTNELLRVPINWLFSDARGELLGLVNDDCLVSDGWASILRSAHEDADELGVVACWHFHGDDFDANLAARKTRTLTGGHAIMVNPWVQGSGVIVKRACVERVGPLPKRDRGFTPFCMRVAVAGWVNGWHLPLVPIEHMDDPRAPHTMLREDEDLLARLPLSAQHRGTRTIREWTEHLQRSARAIHESPTDPRLYVGVRKKARRLYARLRRKELMY